METKQLAWQRTLQKDLQDKYLINLSLKWHIASHL